jgi:hypothetical protein
MKSSQKSASKMSIDERVDDLLSQMTVEEKVSLLAGRDLYCLGVDKT